MFSLSTLVERCSNVSSLPPVAVSSLNWVSSSSSYLYVTGLFVLGLRLMLLKRDCDNVLLPKFYCDFNIDCILLLWFSSILILYSTWLLWAQYLTLFCSMLLPECLFKQWFVLSLTSCMPMAKAPYEPPPLISKLLPPLSFSFDYLCWLRILSFRLLLLCSGTAGEAVSAPAFSSESTKFSTFIVFLIFKCLYWCCEGRLMLKDFDYCLLCPLIFISLFCESDCLLVNIWV